LICDSSNQPTEVVGIWADITERKNFERTLQETNVKLELTTAAAEKANLAKSEFLSNMSHELRTPLNAILGFAQLMESASPQPTASQTKSIARILHAGWYLLELINEVLDLAAIDSGKMSLSKESVSLSEVLSEIQSLTELQAATRGISMTFPHFAEPVFVNADHTRLKQIVINLVSNAINYNKERGTVVIDCAVSASGRIRLACAITINSPSCFQPAQFSAFLSNPIFDIVMAAGLDRTGERVCDTLSVFFKNGLEIGFRRQAIGRRVRFD
jgi:signal transduction histidine kinase